MAEAHKWYSRNPLVSYHSYDHALNTLNAASTLMQFVNPVIPEVLIASIWHDAVFIPGSSCNEQASADALMYEWTRSDKSLSDNDSVIVRACYMIRNTRVSDHLFETFPDEYLNILLDADLSSLASNYDAFIINNKNLSQENNQSGIDNHIEWLSNFIKIRYGQHRNIYRTSRAVDLWENKARANIHRYIEENK